MEKWFRIVLVITAAMNVFGALTFIPANRAGREQFGFPEAHPAYLWFIAVLIFAFGICYFWMAWTQRSEWLFIVIAAIGKLSFFAAFAVSALVGELPFKVILGGLGDLIFGSLFVVWLIKNYKKSA